MTGALTTRRTAPAVKVDCWSCGEPTIRPDGMCEPCSRIDGDAIPDMTDPTWAGFTGYGLATDDVLVAPPNARNVTPRA